MIDMLGPTGSLTMNDVVVTIGAVLSGLVVWRQKAKDEQIKARDDAIDFLKKQIIYLQEQIIRKEDSK